MLLIEFLVFAAIVVFGLLKGKQEAAGLRLGFSYIVHSRLLMPTEQRFWRVPVQANYDPAYMQKRITETISCPTLDSHANPKV